ncbi:cytochrome P450 [Nocardia transvalensis]|nr:cytochrome P450 [Nocardia transvalensis]
MDALSIFGRLLRTRHHLDFLTSLSDRDILQIGFGANNTFMASTPELANEVLRHTDIDKGGPLFERAKEVVGNSLTTCNREEHRRQRRLVQPAFHRSRMHAYASIMSAEIGAMSRSWHEGQPVDIAAETNDVVATILARTLFAGTLSTAEVAQVVSDIDTLVEVAAKRMILPDWFSKIPTGDNHRYRASRRRLRGLMGRVAAAADGGSDYDDLVSMLLKSDDEGEGLSHSEVVDQMTLILIAGIDTTATALAWALYLVSTHPAVERRLHTEVDSVLGGEPVASHRHLGALTYTRHIVAETLRLFPPVWIVTRTAMSDVRITQSVLIPAGSTVIVSPYILHHRADVYPAPGQFAPERWHNGAVPPGAYLPFGLGSRRCIGEHFAETELTLALASIAARWQLRPSSSLSTARPRPRLAASLRPPALPMTAHSRARTHCRGNSIG